MKLTALVLGVLSGFALPGISSAQDEWFARDKAAHFGVGIGMSLGGYAGSTLISDSERARIFMGLGAGLGSAAAKELWDRSHRGTPSWRDFAWSAIGTAAGVTVAWLIDRANGPERQGAGLAQPAMPALPAQFVPAPPALPAPGYSQGFSSAVGP